MTRLEASKSSVFKDEQKPRLMTTVNFTYSLCFSSLALKTALDASGSYPLATYLGTYRDKADLQTVEALWLPALARR